MGSSRDRLKFMKLFKQSISVLALLALLAGHVFATQDFLPPEKAFRLEATWLENSNQVEIEMFPAKGYYIYKSSLKFQLGVQTNKLVAIKPALPVGVDKFDETFQKKLQVYKQPFIVLLEVRPEAGKPVHLEIELQGCAEAGICYPPMTQRFLLAAPGVKVGPIHEAIEGANPQSSIDNNAPSFIELWRERDDINAINHFLENATTAYLFLAFFILGLALAFTPCVLPMLPIMSSVVFGTQGNKPISKRRASLLAVSYVLGMASIYALAGVLMVALGGSVQRAQQSPIAIGGFAVLLLVLSGSLFGFYHLRLPHSWHHQIDRLAGRQKGGSVVGALALGGISTLVASPCITAPLAGVLAFIAQTGSMSLGAGLLFVMALGMGLPLLFIAIEARAFIPSTGMWMVWLQRFLGVLLVVTALWIASPLLQKSDNTRNSKSSNGQFHHQVGSLRFDVIQSNAQLDQYLAKAKEDKKLVLLDFYADWCISCKEMELNTFTNLEVSKVMQQFVLLQADVTKNSADNQALLKHFALFGPPGILIFDQESVELKNQRVIGYMSPQQFLDRLKKAVNQD